MTTAEFSRYLTKFFGAYLPGQRNVSPNTIRSYSDTFRLFLQYCQSEAGISPEKLTMQLFTSTLIEGYLGWLESERKCAISTRNQRLACIHSFVRFVQTELPANLFEMQKILGIPSKKTSHASMSFLTPEAMSALLKSPDTTKKQGRRDLMILTLLYDSGARVQELIDLSVGDIRTDTPATITLYGKGRKFRTVPLMGQTTDMFIQYLKEQNLFGKPEKKSSPLFTNSRKERLSRAGIAYILEKHVTLAKWNTNIVFLKRSVHMCSDILKRCICFNQT
jgi:integrase/recombinase XerD